MEPEPGRAPQCVVSGYTDRLNNDSKILAKAHIIPRELCLTPSDVYDENNQWWLTANLHHAFDGCRWKVDSNGEIFTSFTDKERKQLGLTQSHVNPVVLTRGRRFFLEQRQRRGLNDFSVMSQAMKMAARVKGEKQAIDGAEGGSEPTVARSSCMTYTKHQPDFWESLKAGKRPRY